MREHDGSRFMIRQGADDRPDASAAFRRQVAGEYPTAEDREPDLRTPAERTRQTADFRAAHAEAWRRANPTRAQRQLDLLAFAATVLHFATETYTTEIGQFVALYTAQRDHLGRGLTSVEGEELRDISRRIWAARQRVTGFGPDLPPAGAAGALVRRTGTGTAIAMVG